MKWSFIVELAPWMGGFYKRMIRIMKSALRKSIGRKCLNVVQLQTVLKVVEAVVNSSPDLYVGKDINLSIALTPSHFLTLKIDIGIP